MAESTLNLLEYLHVQLARFSQVYKEISSGDERYVWKISLRHYSLKYEIEQPHKVDPTSADLCFACQWNADSESGEGVEIYCDDSAQLDKLKRHVHPVSYKSYGTLRTTVEGLFTFDEMRYVGIAEDIAKQVYQCSSGDDYFPGYFSEIMLNAEGTRLKQMNWKNARSIDHKQDYTMRDLEFLIPGSAGQAARKSRFDSDQIGDMVILFSDRSSSNNRRCGDLIRERIRLEKLKFTS